MGIDNVVKTAGSFGLPFNTPVTMLELSGAYGAFSTQGVYFGQKLAGASPAGDEDGEAAFTPVTILHMEAADRTIVLDWSAPQAQPVVSPALAYLITSSLSDEAARWPSLGDPNALEIGRPAAAKLGQTPEGREAWAVGYTPSRVVVTWTGARTGAKRRACPPSGGTG
jgi:membrane peptidoglycan carboxypeptidase